jgi:indolepyruvate ferredoxin oxidoreductase
MTHEVLSGNELIIQGGLEAGFHLYTGYPGSPLADFFNILNTRKEELAEKGIKVVIANSEGNAAAMASGAKQAGKHCLVAMKSMGLHVASDALSVGNFANPGPGKTGTVIVVGDDPWSMSTSTPADSRYLFKHLHIPFLEPSTPEELKLWMKEALEISKETSVYQGLLLTTFMAEGGGRIVLGDDQIIENELLDINPEEFDLSQNVMVPPNSLHADSRMIKTRFPKIVEVLEKKNLDKLLGDQTSDVGIISSGVIFETVKQVLEEESNLEKISLYKLACSYPLTHIKLKPWLESLKHLIIVEEKRGFLENELREYCSKHHIKVEIYGKSHFQAFGGLSHEHVQEQLTNLLNELGLTDCLYKPTDFFNLNISLPKRLPTFCPGCPHRETLSLLKDLRKKLKKENIDLITHGDVGCYSLSFLPPFKEMHNLSAMGQGGALGAGFDIFTVNPSVVLMGDSTFFHSGMTDISNSVQLDHNITYILLDNDNTAMTGHQMTPRTGVSVSGRQRPRQDMVNLTKSLGVQQISEINPSDRYFYQNHLMATVKKKGVKVIVSNKECGLTYHGKLKSVERNIFKKNNTLKEKVFYQINNLSCEDCRECVEATGCPGLTQVFDAYGPKVKIDTQICVADSYCTKIKACPSFEKIIVKNYHPTKYIIKEERYVPTDLPDPIIQKTFDNILEGNDLRIVVTGVGGSGVTTISRILAQAAKSMSGRDDLDFKFMDQKGLAQRNGNVTGHLCIYPKGQSRGAITPIGTADLLLSPDLIDGAGQLKFLSKKGIAIFDEDYQVPLSMILNDNVAEPQFESRNLIKELAELLGSNLRVHAMKKASEQHFGKAVYASSMILGVAFQEGMLPFTNENMISAFKLTMRKEEVENNIEAFYFGRDFVIEKRKMNGKKSNLQLNTGLYQKSIAESMMPYHHKNIVIEIYLKQVKRLINYLPLINPNHIARYLHDLYIFDRGTHAEEFISKAFELTTRYKNPDNIKIALRCLAKTYFIKDEVMVSHLMISPLHTTYLNNKFTKFSSSFKREFINRPSFDVMGINIEFNINPKVWMLKIMRQLRVLRVLLPSWHKKEKRISKSIRKELMFKIHKIESHTDQYQALMKLDNIKGYRDIRYEKALLKLGSS